MRDDRILLLEMLIAAHKIQQFVAGMTFADLQENAMAQSAVVYERQVIGEAARNVSEETRAQHPSIEWRAMIELRNRIVHEYFAIKLEVVWDIICDDIPPLVIYLEANSAPDLGV